MNKTSLFIILFSAFWVLASVFYFGGSALEALYLYWLEVYAYGFCCLLVSGILSLVGPWRQKDSSDQLLTIMIGPLALFIYTLFSLLPLLGLSFFDMMGNAWAAGGIRSDDDPRTILAALDAIWQNMSDPDRLLFPALFIIFGAAGQTIHEVLQLSRTGKHPTDLVGKAILTALTGHVATLAMGMPIIVILVLFHNLLPLLFAVVGLRVWLDIRREKKWNRRLNQPPVNIP